MVQPCTPVRAHKLKGLLKKKALVQCLQVQAIHLSSEPLSIHSLLEVSTDQPEMPPQIKAVVQKFQHLFQKPYEFPPSREFDHHIPLVPGAHPVRPYRYSPQQKTEIEAQVATMLKHGVIAHSTSSASYHEKGWIMALLH